MEEKQSTVWLHLLGNTYVHVLCWKLGIHTQTKKLYLYFFLLCLILPILFSMEIMGSGLEFNYHSVVTLMRKTKRTLWQARFHLLSSRSFISLILQFLIFSLGICSIYSVTFNRAYFNFKKKIDVILSNKKLLYGVKLINTRVNLNVVNKLEFLWNIK